VSVVHVVVPGSIDDPARPSGGNVYDRRVCTGLTAAGWAVLEHPVPGAWPAGDGEALDRVVAGLPDGALVLVDGLIGCASPATIVPAAARLKVVVLVHMPLEGPGEGAVLASAQAVLVTSRWTRELLLARYAVPPARVFVATPGVDTAPSASGTPGGGELLCVAAVAPHKGHDLLVDALSQVADLAWHCTCVGTVERDPGFVESVRRQAHERGIANRVRFTGALTGDSLDRAYAGADLLVLASQAETYGMVVAEALAHGVPVLARRVGGVGEALGETPRGRLPGMLVEPAGFAPALRDWLTDARLREALRGAAGERRARLPEWRETAAQIGRVLTAVRAY
jgi:glycosyltransferase involved in cell wall biosynthesis